MSEARTALVAAFVVALSVPTSSLAISVDFDDMGHGQVIQGRMGGLSIAVQNTGGGPDLGVAFSTSATNTADPDLELPTLVNFAGALGNILIIQENASGCTSGTCSNPDDEGDRPAGHITFTFDVPVSSFGLDLIDVDSVDAEGGSFDFFDARGLVGRVGFGELECAAGPFCDPSIRFGNNLANRITPFQAGKFGAFGFTTVRVHMRGSGGVDNPRFVPTELIPEPGSGVLLGAALAGLLALRRRRVR